MNGARWRRGRLAGAATALAILLPAFLTAAAQPPGDAPKRVGVLLEGERDCAGQREFLANQLSSLLAGRGFKQGRNLAFVVRCTRSDPALVDAYARELVAERVDVLMTEGTAKTRALQRATGAIPILTAVGDPVGSGFARTLARPGGNITGLSYGLKEKAQKQLQLLREIVPELAEVVILYGRSYGAESELTAPFVAAAKAAGIETHLRLVANDEEAARALRAIASPRRSAVLGFNMFHVDLRKLADLAARSGIVLMGHDKLATEAGALLSYQFVYGDQPDRVALLLEKLLRGASPAQVPFEFPPRSLLVVNSRTAATLGRPLPPGLLLRADRVIE